MLRAYKCIKRYTDRKGFVIHPLVYHHPVTGEKVSPRNLNAILNEWRNNKNIIQCVKFTRKLSKPHGPAIPKYYKVCSKSCKSVF